jgi:hypothetical protein
MIGCGQLPEQQDSGWFEMAWRVTCLCACAAAKSRERQLPG